MTQIPLCTICKHYWGLDRCRAFPEGIPESVFWGKHLAPIPGDNGLTFENNPIIDTFGFGAAAMAEKKLLKAKPKIPAAM